MKKNTFETICQAVEHGKEKRVEHHLTHDSAKVIACERDNFKVESDGKLRNWAMQNCEESD